MKKKHAWKVVRYHEYTNRKEYRSAYTNYTGICEYLYYPVGKQVFAPSRKWGLFVFKTRQQARDFCINEKDILEVWKCEVEGELQNPLPFRHTPWPEGTFWVNSVKLLHKA